MGDVLLSELCAICHGNPHKYRCPRCGVLTCSVPCVKRHKKWAGCNGVRDPAAYVKPSELATPAGIDRDYNYLTSIEREFDRAERDRTNRGLLLHTGNERKPQGQAKWEGKLNAAFADSAVSVTRAPKGLSRSKANKTRWLASERCIDWTVEFVRQDGSKMLAQCRADQRLAEAHSAVTARRNRLHTNSGDSKTLMQEDLSFALLIPSVPCKEKVVATLDGQATLKEALHGRHVLEFPTIYVFDQRSTAPLPAGFVSDEDHFRRANEQRLRRPSL